MSSGASINTACFGHRFAAAADDLKMLRAVGEVAKTRCSVETREGRGNVAEVMSVVAFGSVYSCRWSPGVQSESVLR